MNQPILCNDNNHVGSSYFDWFECPVIDIAWHQITARRCQLTEFPGISPDVHVSYKQDYLVLGCK